MTIFHKYTVLYCKKIVPNSTETHSNGFIGLFQMRSKSNIRVVQLCLDGHAE